MKLTLLLLVSAGMAKYCTRIDPSFIISRENHPAYLHLAEQFLATDLNADDSATASWAQQFLTEFESNYRQYRPDQKTIQKLKKYVEGLEVKVVGGNWCSDTRLQVPRLCRVLREMELHESAFSYYRVDKKKKPIESDFAATRNITSVPEIVIFYKGTEVGTIIETPAVTLEKDLLKILRNQNSRF